MGKDLRAHLAELEKRMRGAAAELEFEEAARLRDEIRRIKAAELGLDRAGVAPRAAAKGGWSSKAKRKRKGARRRGV